jgi:cyclopropane fatty-acyl-phospholipid synthase-like methyltransferase
VKPEEDAYGALLRAAFEGADVREIVERDDSLIEAGSGPAEIYFAPFRRWPAVNRRAMRFVRGRVLDVGCGAGRVCLHLQERGLDVVGIDISPGAVDVCRRRGVRDVRQCRIEDVDASLGRFDTIVMLGNNFGLFGSLAKARRLLRRFHELTTDGGRIVAETRDVYRTTDPVHLDYHERNRRRGRLPGQTRIRVRYRQLKTPWFDYLMLSHDELKELLAGTGWRLARTLDSDDLYVAVIDRS